MLNHQACGQHDRVGGQKLGTVDLSAEHRDLMAQYQQLNVLASELAQHLAALGATVGNDAEPMPDRRMPVKRAIGSSVEVWSLMCTMPTGTRSAGGDFALRSSRGSSGAADEAFHRPILFTYTVRPPIPGRPYLEARIMAHASSPDAITV
jgi:hypothetical protein